MKHLTLSDLDPNTHTTFSFYECLVSDGYVFRDAPHPDQASQLADDILNQPIADISPKALDGLTALVLTYGLKLVDSAWIPSLAVHCAHGFCELFGNEGQRPQRMRLTRLSMLLRELQDINVSMPHVSEHTIYAKSPWDCLASTTNPNDQWVVSCDDKNLRLMRGPNIIWSQRIGLPTQLDQLGQSIWVGSHYSQGGHLLNSVNSDIDVIPVFHSQPLVLAFTHNGNRKVLDNQGALWDLDNYKVGPQTAQLPINAVHRARIVNGRLYAFDWSKPFTAVKVDLNSWQMDVIDTGGVMVCNDVCQIKDSLYAVCKLQGKVFKLDNTWKTLATRLGAGRGPGRLWDPIVIRQSGPQHLEVLNWFSGKVTRLGVF